MVFGHFTYRDGSEEWTRLESLPTDQQETYWREANDLPTDKMLENWREANEYTGEAEGYPDAECIGCGELFPVVLLSETGFCPQCQSELDQLEDPER